MQDGLRHCGGALGFGNDLPQSDASSVDTSQSSSRNLARMLSENQLDANEPSKTEQVDALIMNGGSDPGD